RARRMELARPGRALAVPYAAFAEPIPPRHEADAYLGRCGIAPRLDRQSAEDVATDDLERTVRVAQVDAEHGTHHAIHAAVGEHPERAVLLAVPPAGDAVVAAPLELADEVDRVGEVELSVAVDRRDVRASCRRDRRRERAPVAAVRGVAHHPKPGVARREPGEHVGGTVGAAVIAEDDLARLRD